MFSGLKQALQKRDLELSASTFMSDFELNIRNSFTEHFDKVSCKGCMFHFSKCIWSRVKKSGLQLRYSVKSQDPETQRDRGSERDRKSKREIVCE